MGQFLSGLLLQIAFFQRVVTFAGVQDVQSSTEDASQVFLLHSGLTLRTLGRRSKPLLDTTEPRSGTRASEREDLPLAEEMSTIRGHQSVLTGIRPFFQTNRTDFGVVVDDRVRQFLVVGVFARLLSLLRGTFGRITITRRSVLVLIVNGN